jgi:hypothetical protein
VSAAPDPQAILRARARARRRTPEGRRMGLFRWAESDGAIWLFPATLTSVNGLVPLASESRWQVGGTAADARFCYWLATAARQDLWRALQGVPGLLPVIRVTPDVQARAVDVALAALVPENRTSAAIEAVLEDMFQPRRINAWTAWARRKAGEPVPGDA